MNDPLPCPCCGFCTLSDTYGSHDICPVCDWEDDAVQLACPTSEGGANARSLADAQVAALLQYPLHIAPAIGFRRSPQWRPLNAADIASANAARARSHWHSPAVVSESQAYWQQPKTGDQPAALGAPHEKIHVLFVCSRNQWRSPTAEQLWRKHPQVIARSGGTSPSARHTVSADDIRWAHVVLVMEEKHKQRLAAAFSALLQHKPVHVLDIPDDYRYMDPELLALLAQSVPSLLGLNEG